MTVPNRSTSSPVAGYDSWGDRPEPQYQLPADRDYTWGFTLVPVKNVRDAQRKALYDYGR